MKSHFDISDTSYNDDWIRKPDNNHPVLVIPYEDGVRVVIGGTEAFKEMSPQQLILLGVEFIKRASTRLKDGV